MRLVVDTNVIVSGILNPKGPPGKIVDAILEGAVTVVYSSRILSEYREVLNRKTFGFSPEDIVAFLEAVENLGELVLPATSTIQLPDETDRPFLDAALDKRCPITTGNLKHFPSAAGTEILSPAKVLSRL